jgi:hypothetical protein
MLRARLQQITQLEAPESHAALIEGLREEMGHSISTLQSENLPARYTCVVHAFHLVEDPTYVQVAASGLGFTFAGPEFITFLLANALLAPRKEDQVVGNDLVFYFENETFRHVGRMLTPTRVVSKWGTGGLYEHEVWEVPSTYGGEAHFYEGPDENKSFELFVKYAESKGFEFSAPDA